MFGLFPSAQFLNGSKIAVSRTPSYSILRSANLRDRSQGPNDTKCHLLEEPAPSLPFAMIASASQTAGYSFLHSGLTSTCRSIRSTANGPTRNLPGSHSDFYRCHADREIRSHLLSSEAAGRCGRFRDDRRSIGESASGAIPIERLSLAPSCRGWLICAVGGLTQIRVSTNQ